MTPILLSKTDVVKAVGLSSRTIDRMEATGDFPPRHRVGGRVLWKYSEIAEWVEAVTS